jgi:hypothetical protein
MPLHRISNSVLPTEKQVFLWKNVLGTGSLNNIQIRIYFAPWIPIHMRPMQTEAQVEMNRSPEHKVDS